MNSRGRSRNVITAVEKRMLIKSRKTEKRLSVIVGLNSGGAVSPCVMIGKRICKCITNINRKTSKYVVKMALLNQFNENFFAKYFLAKYATRTITKT